MRKPLLVFVLAVASLVAWAPEARSQTETDARQMFEEGNTYFQRAMRSSGRARQAALREALNLYHRALRITRSRSVLFNVAMCYELLERYDDAFAYFSEYLAFEDLSDADRAEAEAQMQRVRPNVALVQVASTPEGATIFVDRTDLSPRGVTPAVVAISPGTHTVILTLENHENAETVVDAVRGETREVEVALEAHPARVRFETDPPGAELRLDTESGPVIGTAPASVEVPAGSHRVYAVLGDRFGREAFEAPPGGDIAVAVRLGAPTTPGVVSVSVDAVGAVVSVDGRNVGRAPAGELRLTPGQHRIAVNAGDEYETWSETIDVTPGDQVALEIHLAPAEPRRRFGVWPNVGIVLAGLLAVASGATGGWALSLHSDFNDIEEACDAALGGDPSACAPGTALRDEALALEDRIRPLAIATDVLWGTAVVLGVTSFALLILNREVPDSTSVRIGVAPTPGGAVASIGVGGMVVMAP